MLLFCLITNVALNKLTFNNSFLFNSLFTALGATVGYYSVYYYNHRKKEVGGFMRLEETSKIYKSNGLELTEDVVITINDSELAYEYAKAHNDANIKKLGAVVINNHNAKFNFYFARDIAGSDIKAHEKVVLESNNPYFSMLFATFVPSADIKKHEQIVLKSKDPYLNYYFAVMITKRKLDLDIRAHEKVVLRSKDPEWNFQFVTIPGANIIVHGNVIYKSGNTRWIDAFNDCFKERYEEAKVKIKRQRGIK